MDKASSKGSNNLDSRYLINGLMKFCLRTRIENKGLTIAKQIANIIINEMMLEWLRVTEK